jgi:biotin transport system permease protein
MLTLTCPVETPLHRWPAGLKMAALVVGTTAMFLTGSLPVAAIAAIAVLALHLTGGLRLVLHGLRMLWPLWPFIAVAAAWHLWRGTPLLGVTVILQMLTAVMAANLVTMTTRLDDMIAVLTWVARPLSPILPPRRLALAVALVIRFTPDLMLTADRLGQAWRARSSRRPWHRLVPPLTLSAIDTADRVAEALRARGGAG